MWKIYFWVYAVISVIGIVVSIPLLPSFNLPSYIGLLENVLFTIATYAYVYNRKVFTPIIWRFILVISVFTTLLQTIALFVPATSDALSFIEQNASDSKGAFIFTIIFIIPSLVAAYRLGWKKKDQIA